MFKNDDCVGAPCVAIEDGVRDNLASAVDDAMAEHFGLYGGVLPMCYLELDGMSIIEPHTTDDDGFGGPGLDAQWAAAHPDLEDR